MSRWLHSEFGTDLLFLNRLDQFPVLILRWNASLLILRKESMFLIHYTLLRVRNSLILSIDSSFRFVSTYSYHFGLLIWYYLKRNLLLRLGAVRCALLQLELLSRSDEVVILVDVGVHMLGVGNKEVVLYSMF